MNVGTHLFIYAFVCLAPLSIAGQTLMRTSLTPTPLDTDKIKRAIGKFEKDEFSLTQRIQRDSQGSTLFVLYVLPKEDRWKTAFLTTNGVEIRESQKAVWFNDAQTPVIWFETNCYIFNHTISIPAKANPGSTSIGVMPVLGGKYVGLYWPESNRWSIAEVKAPMKALVRLPQGCRPDCIYTSTEKCFVFWTERKGNDFMQKCFVYEIKNEPWTVSEEITLSRIDKIYDMDTATGNVIVGGWSGPFRGNYIFNVQTKQRRNLGEKKATKYLFLRDDLIRTLNRL